MGQSFKKVLTLHPAGKMGVSIDREKYEHVKKTLLKILSSNANITFEELAELAKSTLLKARFAGSPLWYIVTVKLDLEARRIIERIPASGKGGSHRLKLTAAKHWRSTSQKDK